MATYHWRVVKTTERTNKHGEVIYLADLEIMTGDAPPSGPRMRMRSDAPYQVDDEIRQADGKVEKIGGV